MEKQITDMTMNNLNLTSFNIKLHIKQLKRKSFSCKKIFLNYTVSIQII